MARGDSAMILVTPTSLFGDPDVRPRPRAVRKSPEMNGAPPLRIHRAKIATGVLNLLHNRANRVAQMCSFCCCTDNIKDDL